MNSGGAHEVCVVGEDDRLDAVTGANLRKDPALNEVLIMRVAYSEVIARGPLNHDDQLAKIDSSRKLVAVGSNDACQLVGYS